MSAEEIGVNAVRTALEFNTYIDTSYLKSGDKYPSFDGELLIYKNAQRKKEGLNRVNVQIKSEENSLFSDAISYPVNCVDLDNYMRLGGCFFFVVRYDIKGQTKKVYYNAIYPISAKLILSKRKRTKQGTISLKFMPFPKNSLEQSDLLLNFALDCIKQVSYVASYSLDSSVLNPKCKYVMSYSTYDKSLINPAEYFLDKQIFAYQLTEDGLQIPYDIITFSNSSEPVSGLVSVSGTPYYVKYLVVRSKDQGPKVFVNPSFYFVVNKEKQKISYTYEIKGSLKSRIKDLQFITAAMKNKGFEINGHKLDFEPTASEEYYKYTLELLENYQQIQQALDIAGVTIDLDYDSLTDKDINSLVLLEKIFLKKEPIYNLKEECVPFSMLRIANIAIPMYITKNKEEDKKFNAVSVFDAGIVIAKTDEDIKNGNVSVYCTRLGLEELEEISNLDYDKLYNQIVNAAFTEFHLRQTNDFLLQIILFYDKYQNEEIYNFAWKIAEWLEKYNDKDDCIFTINYLQLKRRKNELSIDEITKLLGIYQATDRNDIKFACLILLDKQDEAMKHFDQLKIEEQNYLKVLPIFKFVKTTDLRV